MILLGVLVVLNVINTCNCHNISTPYLSFLGQNLSNNSYVDISLIGGKTDSSDSVRCHSELWHCCNVQPLVGDWYRPNGTRLPFPGNPGVYFVRNIRSVGIRRSYYYTNSPTGIYHCKIVFNASNPSLRLSLYVGLYTSNGGDINVSGNMITTVVSDLNGESPQFTLTCISTGGPATTVTWTRDSTILTEGTETVLSDPVSAKYSHTLTVTGRLSGIYTCTVANNKPSTRSASLTLQEASHPTGLDYVIANSDVVILTWTLPTTPGYNNGYRIFLFGEGNDNVINISCGCTNSYILTGLTRGEVYNISIIALSEHFFSQRVYWDPVIIPILHSPIMSYATPLPCPTDIADEGNRKENEENENVSTVYKCDSVEPLIAAVISPIILFVNVVQFAIIIFFLKRKSYQKHDVTKTKPSRSEATYEEVERKITSFHNIELTPNESYGPITRN